MHLDVLVARAIGEAAGARSGMAGTGCRREYEGRMPA